MTTLATMKARIADELARDDLTSQIANAITDAICAYSDERWFFNETRGITFPTVANQEFYDSAATAAFATIQKLDYVALIIDNQPFILCPMTPAEIEASSTNGTSTGSPGYYCWYGSQLRLYPVPANAGWTIRIAASVKIAPPATDTETGNPWMTHAERLIRSRAKNELALHVLQDLELAQTMAVAVNEAYTQLREKTNQITQVGKGRVKSMAF